MMTENEVGDVGYEYAVAGHNVDEALNVRNVRDAFGLNVAVHVVRSNASGSENSAAILMNDLEDLES